MLARYLACLVLSCSIAGPMAAHDGIQVPMPADVAPHHKGFIAGERHFDISDKPEYVQHFGDHYISYGRHNYDLSEDPSGRHDFYYGARRWRGMGLGEQERHSMLRKEFARLDDAPAEPWVEKQAFRRGGHYRKPADLVEEEEARKPYGFPRPSWYAIYAKRPFKGY